MRIMRYFLIVLILVMGVSFAVLNPGTMTLNYWVGSKTLPKSLFSVIIFSLGCVAGLVLSGALFVSARFEIFRLQRRLKLAEKEIKNLRVLPMQDLRG